MSRARGKHNVRPATIEPGTDEGRDIGLSDRQLGTPSPIPGGEEHLTNRQTMRQSVPVAPAKPEFRGMNAHGVQPGTYTTHERANMMRGSNAAKDPQPVYRGKQKDTPAPIPVRIVQEGSDTAPLYTTSHRNVSAPAFGTADPVRLVGRNSQRKNVLLLNEDATNGARFASTLSVLSIQGKGSYLPSGMASYLKLDTQDELYAVSNTGTAPSLSIIEVFSMADYPVQG